jgi:hypothetical protein
VFLVTHIGLISYWGSSSLLLIGTLAGGKGPDREGDHMAACSAEVKNA